MSRSGRRDETADIGLRRSSRQRRPIFDSLNQSYLMDPHLSVLFPDEMSTRRGLRSKSNNGRTHRPVVESPIISTRSKRRTSNDHNHEPPIAKSRELMNLHTGVSRNNYDGCTEEIDIYSRVKKRRRHCSQQQSFIVEPLNQHDDSNPSIVTEADSDIVEPKRQGQKLPPKIEPESSGSESIEETIRHQKYFMRPRKTLCYVDNDLPEPKGRDAAKEDDDVSDIGHERRISAYQSPAHRSQPRKNRFMLAKKPSDSSSDSDTCDGELQFERKQAKRIEESRARFLPMNLKEKDIQHSMLKNSIRPRHGASCADVDPMHIDSSIGFESIGGLTQHIYSLKEMILFPLMYPEIFANFKITPPRGVLFYGPPGTGKTLIARALANECSKNNKKVAFFMRKGADCLSKWVGESERQLRLLFDQAYSTRPSIIFFDEIDGLAPVRSSRQDQIHSSIVSTLLALMDGLDERGEVIVIGATNRLDAIDPALRRPGRFDRELRFTMPDKEARKQILRIHTRAWDPPLSDDLLVRLADRTIGYGGADLKGLCTEAALVTLRKTYPQIYAKEERLALDPKMIQVKEEDFIQAMEKQTPCSERSLITPLRAASDFMSPLIGSVLQTVTSLIPKEFVKVAEEPQDASAIQSVLSSLTKRPPLVGRRILVFGSSSECGQTKYIAPALLRFVDHLPIYPLSIANLYSSSNRSPEECITETLTIVSRCGPCVLYLPAIDSWNSVLPQTAWATLVTCIESWTAKTPVLLIATAHCALDQLDDDMKNLFDGNDVLEMPSIYTDEQRRAFFEPLITVEAQRPPANAKERVLEDLPLAPPPAPPKYSESELKELHRQEESVFRELRIFLREIALRLFKDRKFSMFAKPVDLEQAPDYYEIISQPMDLSTIMSKIDQHKYECVQEFLDDIDLICQNALEYNPDKDQSDKIIRHRACDLRDIANALIDTELDWKFEDKLKTIKKARQERGECGPVEPPPAYVYTVKTLAMANTVEDGNDYAQASNAGPKADAPGLKKSQLAFPKNTDGFSTRAGQAKAAAIVKKYKVNASRRKLFSHRRNGRGGPIGKNKKSVAEVLAVPLAAMDDVLANEEDNEATNAVTGNVDDVPVELPEPPTLEIDINGLEKLLDNIVDLSRDYSLVALERLYADIEAIVGRHANTWDRKNLVSDIRRYLRL